MTSLVDFFHAENCPVTLIDCDTENKVHGSFSHFFKDSTIEWPGPSPQRARIDPQELIKHSTSSIERYLGSEDSRHFATVGVACSRPGAQ